MTKPVYLDYSATTPVDPRVVDKMVPYLYERFGNPASHSHAYGWVAEKAVEEARGHVAALIGADPREIVWTSGATEADNLALKGIAHFYKEKGRHLITVKTEHKAILDSMRHLETEGFEVTYLDVEENGLLDLEKLKAAIRPDTILISVMAVNNEIGVVQDLVEIGRICREHKIFFHCDATQAPGHIKINVDEWNVDLMSLSGHKVYGPKGIGALYVRRKPRVRLECQMHGGGHERGMRSGTLPSHQIVGMGEAYRLAKEEFDVEVPRIKALRDRLWDGIRKNIPEVYLNGDWEPAKVKEHGYTGIDYSQKVLKEHPEWIKQAHKLGLKVNVWTVDDPEAMRWFIDRKVDFLTTDDPATALEILKGKK